MGTKPWLQWIREIIERIIRRIEELVEEREALERAGKEKRKESGGSLESISKRIKKLFS